MTNRLSICLILSFAFTISGCGDGSGPPDVACSLSIETESGPAELCVSMDCTGNQVSCAASIGTQTCTDLAATITAQGVPTTATTVYNFIGLPCHSTSSESSAGNVTTTYYGENDLGDATCAAIAEGS